MNDTAPPARRRDAEATKQAILDAAETCFGRAGYDQVGLREIASLAGVDVALVGRYFGSKEELFAQWLRRTPPLIPTLPEDRSQFGEHVARLVLSRERNIPRKMALHHTAASQRAAEMIRDTMIERTIKPMAEWIGGPDANLRASLVFAHLSGLSLTRDLIQLDALNETDRNELIARIGRAIQTYIDD